MGQFSASFWAPHLVLLLDQQKQLKNCLKHTTYNDAFLDRPHNSTLDYFTYGGSGFFFAPYGAYWKFMRKIVISELLNGKTLESLLPIRRDEMIRLLKVLSQSAKVGKSVELEGELIKMTNNVISRMLMSKWCSGEDDKAEDIREIITEIGELIGKFNLSEFGSYMVL